MISKRKQNYELDVKFDPATMGMVDKYRKSNNYFEILDKHYHDISFTIRNDQMPFGSRVTSGFAPVKGFKEAEKRIKNLRKYAKKIKSKCYEPVSVIIVNDKDMYFGSLMAPDYGKRGAK